jgi:peptidyl-prolyl cis-trans isomerase SurA
MKKIILVAFIVIIGLSSLISEVVDEIVAKVGREIILRSELDERMQQLEAAGIDMSQITKFDVLNDMIETKLIVQRAKDEGYEVDEQRLRDWANSQITEISAQFPSEREFRETLRRETGLTVSELRQFYIERFREETLKEQIISNNISRRVTVTESEVRDYYQENLDELPMRPEKYKIGIIEIKIEPSKDTLDKKMKEMRRLRERLTDGESFESLASEHSDCPSSRRGGDLGYFARDMMLPPFEEAAFNMMVNEISPIVRTELGLHIIKVVDKREDEVRVRHILKRMEPTEEDEQRVMNRMRDIKAQLEDISEFSQLAAEYSQHKSAVDGGVLGEFEPDEYPQKYSEYLQDIEVGEISDIIQEDEAMFILAKLDKIPARSFTYEEIYDQLRSTVRNLKELEQYERWINEIMKESYVEVFYE